MMDSFGNIYDNIEYLSTTYLQPNVNKETLLKHKVNICGGTGEVPLLDLRPKVLLFVSNSLQWLL